MANGGVDVTAAEKESIDCVGASKSHDSGVVTAVLGGVGDERSKEDVEIGLEFGGGIVSLVSAEISAVSGSSFDFQARKP